MLKRITKITSLLVTAASIISIVPAYAADVKKIDAVEGTIYNAFARGNGIFIDGEINDKDESQYFMSDNGTFNTIDGLNDGQNINAFLLGKYGEVDDQNTYIHIKDNYKVIDDTVRSNLQDDVATTLRKKIKSDNDGRFSDSNKSFTTTSTFKDNPSGLSTYIYTLKNPDTSTGKTTDTIYVDYTGNYVDSDYKLGNLKVSSTGSSVYIKNTDDTYDLKLNGTTYELKAVISDSSAFANPYITLVGDTTGFVSAYLDTKNSKLYAQTLKLKSSGGLNYIDLSDYDSTDVESKYTLQTGSGTLWSLGNGYIEQWDKSNVDFVKSYKVDGSFNKLSVNTKDNIIAWNQDDGVYSIIHNPTSAATTNSVATTTSAAVTATGIANVSTGWVKEGNTWYYLNTAGILITGWINDNGTWYYADASGALLYNTTVDGYVLGENGAWID